MSDVELDSLFGGESDRIEYHAIDDEYDTTIFTERMSRNASSAMSVRKGIQDYVFPDSDGEAAFAYDLDAADEVEVYAKLPRTFMIPTPVGNYAPDARQARTCPPRTGDV